MPDVGQKPPETSPAPEPQTAFDAALRKIETFVADLEKQHQRTEELAKVPDDIPRFVTTRYTP